MENENVLPFNKPSNHHTRQLGCAFYINTRAEEAYKAGAATWDKLVNYFKLRGVRPDKDGLAFNPVKLKQGPSRGSASVEAVSAAVLDIDDATPLEVLSERIAHLEFCAYSTYRHTAAHPKYRLIFPLARDISPTEWARVWQCANELIGGHADPKAKDVGRLYYLPSCPAERQHEAFFLHNPGVWLDPDKLLKPTAVFATAAPVTPSDINADLSGGLTAPPPPYSEEHEREIKEALNHIPADDYDTWTRIGMALHWLGWGERGSTLWDEWSKRSDKYQEGETTTKWASFKGRPEGGNVTLGTLFALAKEHGWTPQPGGLGAEWGITNMAALNQQFAWVSKQARVFRFGHSDFITVPDFKHSLANQYIQTGRKRKLAAAVWLGSPERREHRDVVYKPGQPQITQDGDINLWPGWGCEPVQGDVTPFRALLAHLFDSNTEMMGWFLQWLAYPIQHPGAKLNQVPVLWSRAYGVGKSLLGDMIHGLYGQNGVFIGSKEIESQFNGWLRGKQFVVGEEIVSGDKRELAARLKHWITGQTIQVEEKYQPSLTLPNTANFMFLSNSAVPVYVEDHDRRYFIWEVITGEKPEEFYKFVADWYYNSGGKQALLHYLMYQVQIAAFNPKGRAPMTDSKAQVIALGWSHIERYLHELKDSAGAGRPLRTASELVADIENRSRTSVTTTAVGRALAQIGAPTRKRLPVEGRQMNYYAVADYEKWAAASKAAWVEEITRGWSGLRAVT